MARRFETSMDSQWYLFAESTCLQPLRRTIHASITIVSHPGLSVRSQVHARQLWAPLAPATKASRWTAITARVISPLCEAPAVLASFALELSISTQKPRKISQREIFAPRPLTDRPMLHLVSILITNLELASGCAILFASPPPSDSYRVKILGRHHRS